MESPEEATAIDQPSPDTALHRARTDLRAGRVREGLARLEALRQSPEQQDDTDRALVLAGSVEAHLARGELSEAAALGGALATLLDADPLAAAIALHARGETSSAAGESAAALRDYLDAGHLAPTPDLDLVPWPGGAALAHVRCHDARAGLALAERHVELARADGRPHVLGYALRVLAAVDTGTDRVRTLREARALLPAGTADLLAAQVDTDLAGLLLMAPDAADDLDPLSLLRGAELTAGHQELWPLQGRIRRLLELLGEQPRRLDSEAAALLTASERRVARLVVDGLRNREVAERLGVSVKAVEWHLSHVYRKLAITSRAQLAATLGRGL